MSKAAGIPIAWEQYLPNAADVRFYRLHGWFVSRKILSDKIISAALEGCRRFYDGERDWVIPKGATHLDWEPAKGDVLRTNAYVSLQIREVRAVVRRGLVAAIAARLCGTKSIRLFRDVVIWKPPAQSARQTRVGWHTDIAYWPTCTSRNMLTAWIPLGDCDVRNGTLSVVDGSHRWPNSEQHRHFERQDLDSIENSWKARRRIRAIPLSLKAGQVSFHHCRTLHASGENRSDLPRVSLAIHFQDHSNRYRRAKMRDGRICVHRNDLLCRPRADGSPDYSDPDICPELWRAQAGNRRGI